NAVDAETGLKLFKVRPISGASKDLDTHGIAIYKQVAADKGLKVGDTIPVVFKDSGEKQMRVAMIYAEHQPAGDYFMGMTAYNANVANHFDSFVYVKKAPGSAAPAAL